MADDQYDKVLLKAEISGLSSLSRNEVELFKRLANEISTRGNRARELLK